MSNEFKIIVDDDENNVSEIKDEIEVLIDNIDDLNEKIVDLELEIKSEKEELSWQNQLELRITDQQIVLMAELHQMRSQLESQMVSILHLLQTPPLSNEDQDDLEKTEVTVIAEPEELQEVIASQKERVIIL